jgi:hypothetical protein
MIQFTCPNCKSQLRAKAELAGHARRCPKCGTEVRIEEDDAAQAGLPIEESGPGEHAEVPTGATLAHRVPERLDRHGHYLICDARHLLASWEGNGRGWQIKTQSGLISAIRNRDKLPTEGDFKLVELSLATTEAGHRLQHVTSYQLARRWALLNLAKGDDAILAAVTGPTGLSRDQKNLVRAAIKDRFMHEVWEKAQNVLDYLGSPDYHTPGA